MARVKKNEEAVNHLSQDETSISSDSIHLEGEATQEERSNIIEPIAVDICLRITHPQESYGRCGLRFKKGETQRIAFHALEPEALQTLIDDPWLELVYVTE